MSTTSAEPQLDSPASLQQPRTEQFYRPELDGLRFFAFLAVFWFHFPSDPAFFYSHYHIPVWLGQLLMYSPSAGQHGVDLFFALSAYLITELLMREKDERGSLDVRSFYIRRILRIWPLYYLTIIVFEVVSLLIPSHPFPFPYFLAFSLLAGNWGVIVFHKAFIFATLWSVSIEEQFYLLWPPVVARLTRRGIAGAAVLMIVVANLTRVVMLLAHCKETAVYFSTLVRLDEIAGGILLAVLLRHRVPNLRNWIRMILLGAAILCVVITGYLKTIHPQAIKADILVSYSASAACCTLIVYSVLGMRLKSKSLRYLGKISYGLYVFHIACIQLVDKYFKMDPRLIHALLKPIFSLGLTILVSALSYRFIESPFLKLKRHFTYVQSRPV
ncbi:MAG TPA: acyltransferase [Terriglobales bacterium]|nr:acyltransferase [Terracidiphilus sp.]HVO95400.1 acyltransferase [Terriglobales bacterium]